MLDILDPTMVTGREHIAYASRPGNLQNLRIGLIENTKRNAQEILLKVAEKLNVLHGMNVEVLLHKHQRAPLKESEIAELAG